MKTPERHEVTSVVMDFLVLTLSRFQTLPWGFYCYFKQVNACWVYLLKVSNRDIRTVYWIMFKLNNKDIRKKSLASYWCFYHSILASFSIAGFEQAIKIAHFSTFGNFLCQSKWSDFTGWNCFIFISTKKFS